MKPLGKFVIFYEDKEEFLCASQQQTDMKMLGWSKSPSSAIKYDNLKTARSEAQRIATNEGCALVICQLHESNTQIALSEEARVSPSTDPSRH